MWIHEMVGTKEIEGDLKILFPFLSKDPKKFFNFVLMSINTFEEPLAATEISITKWDTNMRTFFTMDIDKTVLKCNVNTIAFSDLFRHSVFSDRVICLERRIDDYAIPHV